MAAEEYRLGDLIDDYCLRCKLLLNHAIASLIDGQVVKVICQTCFTEHAYRHGEGGKKAPTHPRATLFDQVLAQATPTPVAAAPESPKPKKKTGTPARYINRRHKTKPPRTNR